MNQTVTRFGNRFLNMATATALATVVASAALLAGCASTDKGPASNAQFDFGSSVAPITPNNAALALPAVIVADVTGNPAYDNERMFYRLNYADPLQSRSYANSRWSAAPMQMLTQRFKARMSQAGIKVLSATDGASGVPLLRIDVDDFTHSFDSTVSSYGQLVLRASLFDGRNLVDQRTFSSKVGAASADAAGGAYALVQATDAVSNDMIAWLATFKPRTMPKQQNQQDLPKR
jgi:cholesterol transport system auxiliary component